MDKKKRIKELLDKLKSLENVSGSLNKIEEGINPLMKQLIDEETSKITTKLKDSETLRYLKEVSSQIEEVKKGFDLEPLGQSIIDSQSSLSDDFKSKVEELSQSVDEKINGMLENTENDKTSSEEELSELKEQISSLNSSFGKELNNIQTQIKSEFHSSLKKEINAIQSTLGEIKNKEEPKDFTSDISEINERLETLRSELNSRIANLGGGAMNRQIRVDGTDVLTKYTDINLISGSGVTLSTSTNDTAKRTNITLTGGGGVIGSVVIGGVDEEVLFVDGTVLSGNSGFTFDKVSQTSLLGDAHLAPPSYKMVDSTTGMEGGFYLAQGYVNGHTHQDVAVAFSANIFFDYVSNDYARVDITKPANTVSVENDYAAGGETELAAPLTISSISKAGAADISITTSGAHSLSTGDTVTIYGVSGSDPNINIAYYVTVTGANTFTLDDTGVYTYTSLGTGGFAVESDWNGQRLVEFIWNAYAPANKGSGVKRVIYVTCDANDINYSQATFKGVTQSVMASTDTAFVSESGTIFAHLSQATDANNTWGGNVVRNTGTTAAAAITEYQSVGGAAKPAKTITGISTGATSTITTSTAHGFVTGEWITLASTNSTPNVDGRHFITNTGANTFTIVPATTVTGAGTSGTATIRAPYNYASNWHLGVNLANGGGPDNVPSFSLRNRNGIGTDGDVPFYAKGLGLLGIFNTSPTCALDITGNMKLSGTLSRLNLATTNTAGTEGVIYQNGIPIFHTYNSTNVFIGTPDGYPAGNLTLTGNYNVAVGRNAMPSLTTGSGNMGIGNSALQYITDGSNNSAIGFGALSALTVATAGNVAIGYLALANLTVTFGAVVGIGYNCGNGAVSGVGLSTGYYSTLIGSNTDVSVDGLSYATAIGFGAVVGASNTMALGGTAGNAVDIISGGTTASAKLHLIKTTEQLRIGYDVNNYWNATTGSTGITTFNAVGSGSAFAFSDPVSVTGALSATTTVTASTYFLRSVGNALTAVGTTRADALQLAKEINNVTTAAAGTGVILPVGSVGMRIVIFNAGANAIKVYGSASETIDGTAGATGVTLTNAKRCEYFFVAANTWISAQLGVVSA